MEKNLGKINWFHPNNITFGDEIAPKAVQISKLLCRSEADTYYPAQVGRKANLQFFFPQVSTEFSTNNTVFLTIGAKLKGGNLLSRL
jgi:hypothetical protein